MKKAERVGLKILASLATGRAKAIAQNQARSTKRKAAIALLAREDLQKGHSSWGRAGRIQRKLADPISVRQVKRLLDSLLGMSDLGE